MVYGHRITSFVYLIIFLCPHNQAGTHSNALHTKEITGENDLQINVQQQLHPFVKYRKLIRPFVTSDSLNGFGWLPRRKREKRSLSSDVAEKKILSLPPLVSVQNNVQITPKISLVKSTSVQISWTVSTVQKGIAVKEALSRSSLGLKVKYRPFGSTIEREIIFVIESRNFVEGEDRFNHYLAQNLLPGTGYVFCFSLIQEREIADALDSDEYNKLPSTETNTINASAQIISNPITISPVYKTIETTTLFTTKAAVAIKSVMPEPLAPLTEPPTTATDSLEIVTDPQTTTTEHITTTEPFSDNTKYTVHPPEPKQGTYAYSSTGELIFLPGSSWQPFRKKRSINWHYKSLDFLLNHSIKKRGTYEQSEEKQCIEIFTEKSADQVSLNPLVVLIIMLVIFGVLISLSLIYCIRKFTCSGSIYKFIKRNTSSENDINRNNSKVESNSDTPQIFQKDRIECLAKSSDDTSSLKIVCHCRTSSLPSYQEILTRHDLKEQLKGSLQIKTKQGIDALDFHPGYDLPPMSTNDIYGYDIPKLSNRGTRGIATPSTAHSCDLNDRDSEFGWDLREIYNLDNCPDHRKRSEGYKKIYSAGNFDEDDVGSPKSKQSLGPSTLEIGKMIHKSITDLNFDATGLESSEEPRLYKYANRIRTPTEHLPYHPTESLSLPPFIPSRDHRPKDDVTVTGGTLIEVPEGYLVPGRSKNISLVATGNPVYI